MCMSMYVYVTQTWSPINKYLKYLLISDWLFLLLLLFIVGIINTASYSRTSGNYLVNIGFLNQLKARLRNYNKRFSLLKSPKLFGFLNTFTNPTSKNSKS